MASIEAQITEIAGKMAVHQQHQATYIQQQLNAIEDQKAKLLTERDLARRARERLADFQVKIGIDYQCPRCWIERETRSALTPIGGGTRHEDFFRCHTCGLDLSFAV